MPTTETLDNKAIQNIQIYSRPDSVNLVVDSSESIFYLILPEQVINYEDIARIIDTAMAEGKYNSVDPTPLSENSRILSDDIGLVLVLGGQRMELHPPKNWEKTAIDYSLFNNDAMLRSPHGIEKLNEFLDLPYLSDSFGSDTQGRVNHKRSLNDTYSWYHEFQMMNALKKGNVSNLHTIVKLMDDKYIGPEPERFHELAEKILAQAKEPWARYTSNYPRVIREGVLGIKKNVHDLMKLSSLSSYETIDERIEKKAYETIH